MELLYFRRNLERSVWSFYIGGEILRGLFKAIILAEVYDKGVERIIWSIYIWGGIWKKVFQPIILVKKYNKGLRELFKAFIIGEGYGEACSEQLY